MLLTMNWRNEIKNRISMIDVIKENLTDVEAELEEVRKRNPLVKTKSENERSGSCGKDDTNIAIILSNKERLLSAQAVEYKSIINDHNKGWKMLNKRQQEILEFRFKDGRTQESIAKELDIDVRTVRRIESEALRIMEIQMLKY